MSPQLPFLCPGWGWQRPRMPREGVVVSPSTPDPPGVDRGKVQERIVEEPEHPRGDEKPRGHEGLATAHPFGRDDRRDGRHARRARGWKPPVTQRPQRPATEGTDLRDGMWYTTSPNRCQAFRPWFFPTEPSCSQPNAAPGSGDREIGDAAALRHVRRRGMRVASATARTAGSAAASRRARWEQCCRASYHALANSP